MSDDLSGFSMMELFRAEAEGQTAILASGLLALEGADASPATIEPLMRAAHSLKGAARIVGVDSAVRVAHVMEDCFVAAQHGKLRILPAHVDVLLNAVDLLTRISQVADDQVESWQAENEPVIAAMVADLTAILEGGTPAAAPAPALPAEPAEPVAEPETATASPPPAPEPPPLPPAPAAALPAAPPAPPAPAPEQAERVVRVTADSLSRLVGLAGESLVQSRQLRPIVDSLQTLRNRQSALTETLHALEERLATEAPAARTLLARAKTQVGECSQTLLDRLEDVEDFARRSEDLSGRLHHEVLSSRMRPLADGIKGFPRLVRDVARQLGKKVEFEVRGETTGVDRDILEKLEAPLNHLIRNGLDHAIEMPEERVAAGKDPVGTIRLEARHRAGMLQITLSDDGRGIDSRRLRAKVVERGLATAAMAEQMTEAELLEFLFLPGFSTKEAVTELSGRGVGLDVVQNMVRAVGGIVRVSTQVGKGTRFALQLPITRSVIRALLVRIAGEPYAFPLNRIDRILALEHEQLKVLEGRRHFLMDDQPVGLVDAAQVLNLPPLAPGGSTSTLSIVVASDRSHRFGMIVEAFLGERDLEVRPLDPRLGKVPDINSASVLEDGFPVLIIDVEDMVRSIDNLLSGRRLKAPGEALVEGKARSVKRVLVVDDSLTVRELERQMLEGRGYKVDIAVDGLDGWNAVRAGRYDLVISDVDMPRMDGIQLVSSIKTDGRLRALPVVIVSYKDRPEDRVRGLDAGADAYLTKSSFHDQTLLETVADLIGEARE
ncbi:MAG: hybrid sensor histidine kinase/response regulator [Isosphaeraceae bacterium]|nr:hybrid sensor histidine kinase/response regulator [Isosphaeraceae bacterium]